MFIGFLFPNVLFLLFAPLCFVAWIILIFVEDIHYFVMCWLNGTCMMGYYGTVLLLSWIPDAETPYN